MKSEEVLRLLSRLFSFRGIICLEPRTRSFMRGQGCRPLCSPGTFYRRSTADGDQCSRHYGNAVMFTGNILSKEHRRRRSMFPTLRQRRYDHREHYTTLLSQKNRAAYAALSMCHAISSPISISPASVLTLITSAPPSCLKSFPSISSAPTFISPASAWSSIV